jgi:hypothetical protein
MSNMPSKTTSEVLYERDMVAGSKLLLEALVRKHKRIVSLLVRKNGMGTGEHSDGQT